MMKRDIDNCRSIQPPLPDMDWRRLAQTPFVFVGAGAVNGPLALDLANLGMKRFALVVDPKAFKNGSISSQCAPEEVGQPKALVLARRLRDRGVETFALVADVFDVDPGWI